MLRLLLLIGLSLVFVFWYWLSTLQICFDHHCYGYATRVFWSAIVLKFIAYFSAPLIFGAVIGWLSFSWRMWLGSTAIAVGVLAIIHFMQGSSGTKEVPFATSSPSSA